MDLEFCLEAIKGLRPFQYKLKRERKSKDRRPLAKEFFGFCLAVPCDEAECNYVLECVRESGVGAVRFDFTCGQDYDLSAQLLQGLHASGVSVLLHLVPSLETAKQMAEPGAVDQWKTFMGECLDRFSSTIEAIEVGSTINRAKWSGLDLASFIAMWEMAHAFCKSRDIPMVGPNVTDFEPQYNAGMLGMLARRNLLPSIHSNNLFAERSVEPEVADHKIMGVALRNLHGYNLRKKISLIAAIARRYGVERNWSTCAFWTIPRIKRYLDDPEEQMADYLARYYILCASVGAFERIFWGPLVSYREGLIDDGTEDRSISDHRDIVAFYAAYAGEFSQWRRRPAFHALRALVQQLSGFHYHDARCAGHGLEIHEFQRGDQICLVAWTVNGGLARVKDCFAAESLESIAAIYLRDGATEVDCPDFITESPIYFFWSKENAPHLMARPSRLPQTVAARAPEGFRYYDYSTKKWRGVLLARSRDEAASMVEAIGPEAIENRVETSSLRKSRNAIWSVVDPRDPEHLLVVKKPRRIAWHKRILDRNKPSKALRSWNGSSDLMRRGIKTPTVVAYFESTDPKNIFDNWFFCEHVDEGHSVRHFFTAYAKGKSQVKGITFKEFAGELINYVFFMHNAGVYFRDLASGNILVRIFPNVPPEFSLIDTARVRCVERIKLRHRLADLKRLTLKLDKAQQSYFMDEYLSRINQRLSAMTLISFRLYAWKVRLKRYKRQFMKKFR